MALSQKVASFRRSPVRRRDRQGFQARDAFEDGPPVLCLRFQAHNIPAAGAEAWHGDAISGRCSAVPRCHYEGQKFKSCFEHGG